MLFRSVGYSDKILIMGSCFAENIGQKMKQAKLNVEVNPFGILFNPESIAVAIEQAVSGVAVGDSDVFQYNGLWSGFGFHGSFSSPDTLTMKGFPYLWAGMSPKGMDCSGFVRTVLFMHDIIIPRDAGPQSRTGQRLMGFDDLQPGDLVFFGRNDTAAPKVSHVGFYLGDGRFIHSLGLVKIGSFRPEDPLYDAYNTGRYLFASRVLPFIDKQEGLNTTLTNPYYNE